MLVVILILGSLGAFYFYNKSVAPVVPEVPVVEDIDTTVPADTTVDNKTNVTTPTYTDKDFGFSFEYPVLLGITTDNTGKITLVNPPGIMRNSTIIEKFTGSVANGSGKFGSNTISYVNNNWVADRQNEQTGNHYTEIISPSAYTTSGLPIFFSNYTHGSGSYAYAVALTHTKFLRIVGSDEDAYIDGHYDDSKDPTYKIVKSVAVTDQMQVTIMVPNDITAYNKAIYAYGGSNTESPSVKWPFVKKTISVRKSDDIIRSSAEAAALEIRSQADSNLPLVRYLKIKDGTAYVLLNFDLDGWAGVSYAIYAIHPLVEKTLLQFPEIKTVKFAYAPGDSKPN